MSPSADEVYRAGLELDSDERAVVAHSLLASLHPEGAARVDLDETWKAELRRRVLEIEDSSIELVSSEESQARVRKLLVDLRS
jgi:putative addiction module component (TIGR02574 family)